MKYLKRALESKLLEAIKQYKVVILTGMRQSGKSTLLRHLFPDRRYVTLDDPFLENQARQNGDLFLQFNAPPVTIDEVQYAGELFRYIKLYCDNSAERGLFCLSGSQPFHLMKNVTESLAGRACILEMSNMSLREIQGDEFSEAFVPTWDYIKSRQASSVKPQSIWNVVHRGGYPELLQTEIDWGTYYSSYLQTYLERDVRQLSAVQDLDVFRRFMISVAARTGQILNYANIADEIGKDAGTIKKWISILAASGIIYLLEPFSSSTLKRAIKTPKLYFRDTGLAAYLLRWLTPDTLALGAMSGAFFETFVVNEIIKSYANKGLDYRYAISYYRGRDKNKSCTGEAVEREIDLIIEENGVLYPIEIKQALQGQANQTAAFQILDNVYGKTRGTGAILCNCPAPGLLRENIFQIPVWYI